MTDKAAAAKWGAEIMHVEMPKAIYLSCSWGLKVNHADDYLFRKGENMTFTDDDLKRLKERCESGYLPILNDQGKGFALLSRLAAAERVIDLCTSHAGDWHHAYDAWRGAAGK